MSQLPGRSLTPRFFREDNSASLTQFGLLKDRPTPKQQLAQPLRPQKLAPILRTPTTWTKKLGNRETMNLRHRRIQPATADPTGIDHRKSSTSEDGCVRSPHTAEIKGAVAT